MKHCCRTIQLCWNVFRTSETFYLSIACASPTNTPHRRTVYIASKCSWPLIMCSFWYFFFLFSLCVLITQSVSINYQVCVISLLANAVQNKIQYDLITCTVQHRLCLCLCAHNANVFNWEQPRNKVVYLCFFFFFYFENVPHQLRLVHALHEHTPSRNWNIIFNSVQDKRAF